MKTYKIAVWCMLPCIASLHAFAGQAARQGDQTDHGGFITTGSTNVHIAGSPAARTGDTAVCPQATGDTPHVGGAIIGGSPTVLINGMPAARVGDTVPEAGGAVSTIVTGSSTVLIGD